MSIAFSKKKLFISLLHKSDVNSFLELCNISFPRSSKEEGGRHVWTNPKKYSVVIYNPYVYSRGR